MGREFTSDGLLTIVLMLAVLLPFRCWPPSRRWRAGSPAR
ncbi:hypothetical protein A8924_0916 [Saccharopolyspora erythraea NRRL 2338]|nr:hypothetical protein A8924_0916 [Saccharopolyspora erythraea NRRL 2338]